MVAKKKRGRAGVAAPVKSSANNANETAKPIPKRLQSGAAAKSVIESMAGIGSSSESKNKNIDEHPLAVNHFVVVRYRDDSPRLAKILGVGARPSAPELQQYYVHYLDFNRRMDEWIKVDRIILLPSGANPLGKERMEAEELIHKQKHATISVEKSGSHLDSSSPDNVSNLPPIRVKEKISRKDSFPLSGPPLKRANSNISAISLVSMRSDRSSRNSRNGDDDNEDQEQPTDDDDYRDSEDGVDDENEDEQNEDDDGSDNSRRMDVSASEFQGEASDEDEDDEESRSSNDTQEARDSSRNASSGRGNLLASTARRGYSGSSSQASHMSLETLNRGIVDNRKQMLSLVGSSGNLNNAITNIEELEHDEHEGLDEELLREHEELTKIKNFNNVMLGKHVMECWYFSPFPREFWLNAPVDCIYFCEFTLRFFSHKDELIRYQNKLPKTLPRHPPGNEIYRDAHVSMFEVDGAVEKIYCQNLSYFAKLFLDHKTLFEDVDVFLFYVLCTYDDRGYHPVGYFSKNKYSDAGYNLACILTFPSAQRRGYGRFLIAFSYELSKKELKVGSPEKPLSDLGNLSYRSYWANVILNVLKTYTGKQISVMDICKITSIVASDVILTLDMLDLVYTTVDSGDPAGSPTCLIVCTAQVIDDLLKRYPANGLSVDAEKLHWAPLYVTDPKRDRWTIAGKLQAVQ